MWYFIYRLSQMIQHCLSVQTLINHYKAKIWRKTILFTRYKDLIVGWSNLSVSIAIEGSLQSLLLRRTYDFGLKMGKGSKQIALLYVLLIFCMGVFSFSIMRFPFCVQEINMMTGHRAIQKMPGLTGAAANAQLSRSTWGATIQSRKSCRRPRLPKGGKTRLL